VGTPTPSGPRERGRGHPGHDLGRSHARPVRQRR
jgi:hypothetical protein